MIGKSNAGWLRSGTFSNRGYAAVVGSSGSCTYVRFDRTTPRHTTHHKDLPEYVTIIRPYHPFEGNKLAVFGRRRYQGKSHLILTLPDGSRSLMPVEWTDLDSFKQDSLAHRVVAFRFRGHRLLPDSHISELKTPSTCPTLQVQPQGLRSHGTAPHRQASASGSDVNA
jgi:hypothetical protein